VPNSIGTYPFASRRKSAKHLEIAQHCGRNVSMPGDTEMSTDVQARWYALAVYARQEKAAALMLCKRGHEVFLPVRVERHKWSDRMQKVEACFSRLR